MYMKGGTTHVDCVSFKKSVQALFLKYNVDVYLSGHKHDYYRLVPTGNKTQNPWNTAFFVPGAAGCDESKLGNITTQAGGNNADVADLAHRHVHPEAVSEGLTGEDDGYTWDYHEDTERYSTAVMEVVNSTTLVWWLHDSADNGVLDQVTWTRRA